MEITKIKLENIKPYKNNAKEHPESQIEQIELSIKEYGNNDPIAVDEDFTIIEGHGRFEALKRLGFDEAECIILRGLSEDQKKAYRIVHNQLTMNSDFDLAVLEEEIKDIAGDLSAFGLDLADDPISLETEIPDLKDPSDKPEREITCPHCGGTFLL